MTADAIEALSEDELRDALAGRGIDLKRSHNKEDLVQKALSL